MYLQPLDDLDQSLYAPWSQRGIAMSKITRIAYNSSGWQHPTGDALREEASGTYNSDNGFGHEDWLFRSEWQIEGWCYAFLQGFNKSHAKWARKSTHSRSRISPWSGAGAAAMSLKSGYRKPRFPAGQRVRTGVRWPWLVRRGAPRYWAIGGKIWERSLWRRSTIRGADYSVKTEHFFRRNSESRLFDMLSI